MITDKYCDTNINIHCVLGSVAGHYKHYTVLIGTAVFVLFSFRQKTRLNL